ncbi:MAG: GNAT family N-acetyltransferase [Anaerolineae bacterium]
MNEIEQLPLIRNYNDSDLASCRALWVELTEWHRQIYQSPGIGGDNPGLQFDEHLEKVGAENIWVAELDGRIAGLTGLIPGEGEAELEPLVVSKTDRGQGIGRQLAETVIKTAQERGVGQLTVRPVGRNAQAIQFYHSLGFNILGYIDLFMDFAPEERQVWRQGEQLAGRAFKV